MAPRPPNGTFGTFETKIHNFVTLTNYISYKINEVPEKLLWAICVQFWNSG
jgi:hypothetical protein